MNVLVIAEDFRKDQYILRPILRAVMGAVGKPHAHVEFAREVLGGVDQALSWRRIEAILQLNPMVHLFLLCVDRDGREGRRQALDAIENQAKATLPADRLLLAENAWQEIEVWALAGLPDLPAEWKWPEIREEPHPKERFFVPVAKQRGVFGDPGEGRKTLAEEAVRRYSTHIRQRCEEIRTLEDRIRQWVARVP
jgi:hypothetical protein